MLPERKKSLREVAIDFSPGFPNHARLSARFASPPAREALIDEIVA